MNTTCLSCRWSYSEFTTFATGECSVELRCNPGGNPKIDQIAHKLCDGYERESGADEHEQ